MSSGRMVALALALFCAGCGSTEKREAQEPARPRAPVAEPDGAEAPAPPGGPLLAQADPNAGPRGPIVAQGGPGGERPRPPAGGPVGGSLKEQERRALADSYYKAGERLHREMKYHEAAQQLRLAVKADPNNAEAQRLLDQVLYILGDRTGGLRDSMRQISHETMVRIDMERREVERLFAEGQLYMNKKEFDRAAERFERVLESIRYFPYNIDLSGLQAQAKEALGLARDLEKERAVEFKRQLQKAAKEEAAVWEQRNLAYHHARVRTLLEQATFAYERVEFEKAHRLAEQVLELDPKNNLARKIVQQSVTQRRFQAELEMIETNIEEMKRLIEGVYSAAVPYQKIFMFPDDRTWEAVQRRTLDIEKMFAQKGHTESAEEQRIKRTLESSKISINFPGTAFNDAIDFLRDVTGINYVVAKGAQEQIESGGVEINLKLNDITLKNALELLLTEAGGLIYRVKNDAVVINTADAETEELFLRFYEVSEIVQSPPDNPAPTLALKRPTEEAAGGGGAGAILNLGDDEPTGGPGIDRDKLIELIEQKLGDDGEGTVEFFGGLLMVRKSLNAHAKIQRLLEQLRNTTGIMVTVETKIIDIQDNFLEEIGVDFRGLPALVPGLGGTFQNLGANWTNAAGDIDLRAALVNQFSNALGSAAGTPFNLASLGGGAFQYNLLDDFQLQAIIDAVKRKQNARQVDAQRITVFNGQQSHVLNVTQEAYISDIEVNQTGVTPTINPVINVLNSGSILEARPIVSYDRKFVTLELHPTIAVDQQPRPQQRLQLIQGQGGTNTDLLIDLPVVSLSEIRGTVVVPDGGTVIMGGLKNFLKQEQLAGLPIVRHIPLLHNLFERKGYSDMKRSLIVLLTVDITIVREAEARRFNKQGPSWRLE